jgi:hypothetical protein
MVEVKGIMNYYTAMRTYFQRRLLCAIASQKKQAWTMNRTICFTVLAPSLLCIVYQAIHQTIPRMHSKPQTPVIPAQCASHHLLPGRSARAVPGLVKERVLYSPAREYAKTGCQTRRRHLTSSCIDQRAVQLSLHTQITQHGSDGGGHGRLGALPRILSV